MLREQRFANAARAHDADEAVTVHQRAERIEFIRAPEQGGQFYGQVRAQRCRGRQRPTLTALGPNGLGARDEAVAAPRNGRDHGLAHHPAKRTHLCSEVVLLHHEVGPHDVHQRALADEAAGTLGQSQ
jgi:hypothetical protein